MVSKLLLPRSTRDSQLVETAIRVHRCQILSLAATGYAWDEAFLRLSGLLRSGNYLRDIANTLDDYRTGVLCIILCFALGIANLFHVSLVILFSALCL
jgi:hypothetical protein